ncbi:MAG: hypothetical protein J6J58_01590, partial [Oscillospiraceae bacterium]|nr:hypothetical protein [Oscillospiraceae bacterium]
ALIFELPRFHRQFDSFPIRRFHGELAKAMRKGNVAADAENIKDTIDEELWDIIYYAIAIANCYDIDLEQVIKVKENINNKKYNTNIVFEQNR